MAGEFFDEEFALHEGWWVSLGWVCGDEGYMCVCVEEGGEGRGGDGVTFSRRTWIWDSVFCSSSVGLGAMLGADAKRE